MAWFLRNGAATDQTLTLISLDGMRFQVKEFAANKSRLLKNMIDLGCIKGEIPIPMHSFILEMVVDFFNLYEVEDKLPFGMFGSITPQSAIPSSFIWWVKTKDKATLKTLAEVADFLDIKVLWDGVSARIAEVSPPLKKRRIIGA